MCHYVPASTREVIATPINSSPVVYILPRPRTYPLKPAGGLEFPPRQRPRAAKRLIDHRQPHPCAAATTSTMAPGYYSAVPPPPNLDPNAQTTTLPLRPAPQAASTTPIDIEAWTVSALASLRVSPVARGTGRPLTISLDDDPRRIAREARHDAAAAGGVLPRKLPPARDSLRRREELRKGKEGSRQRRRWENGTSDTPSAILNHPPLVNSTSSEFYC